MRQGAGAITFDDQRLQRLPTRVGMFGQIVRKMYRNLHAITLARHHGLFHRTYRTSPHFLFAMPADLRYYCFSSITNYCWRMSMPGQGPKGLKFSCCLLVFVFLAGFTRLWADDTSPARGPNQPIDEEYTRKIHEYTTQPYFSSPLVDYLPASKNVPTPKVVLGDIAGAPGILPYSKQVYEYMRMLEKASPRVKVYSIVKTEEGREMIAVAISSEENLAHVGENRLRLAQLADPRTIKMDDAEAERII